MFVNPIVPLKEVREQEEKREGGGRKDREVYDEENEHVPC